MDKCPHCENETYKNDNFPEDLISYCGVCGKQLVIHTCSSSECVVNQTNVNLPSNYNFCPVCGSEAKNFH